MTNTRRNSSTRGRPQLALRASVVAIQGAIAVLCGFGFAHAQTAPVTDPAVLELVKPANSIEAGIIYVDKDSAKFGEFNGLNERGVKPLLNLEFRGGGAYDAYDQGSGAVDRWSVYGRNLGTEAREFGVEYGRQGIYRLGLEYNELERNQYDNYMSLWRGVGGQNLTLPPGYPAAAARTGTAGLANWNNIQTPNLNATTTGGGPGSIIPGLMQRYDIGTTRIRTGVAGEVNITDSWVASFTARNERKDGTKLTGTTFGGFRGALLAEPIDFDTNIVETAVRWKGKQGHFGIGYNLSLFRNHTDTWSAENPFANNVVLNNRVVMAGAPDNEMHQWTVDGGWRFAPNLKGVFAASQSTMKQDDTFHYQAGPGWRVPGARADMKEVQTNVVARLNWQAMRDLDVTAGYKYDHRDNRSPHLSFVTNHSDSPAAPSAQSIFNNVPLNRKDQRVTLDGRWNLKPHQSLTAGYEHNRVERSADGAIAPFSDEIHNPFASGRADENTFKLGYRHAFSDALNAQVQAQHSKREAHDYEEPTIQTVGASTNVGGFQTVPGFRQFFLNDRNRDKLRGSLDWQVNEKFMVQGAAEWLNDRFPARYGLKKTNSTIFSLDSTYSHSDAVTLTGYLSWEDAHSQADHYQLPVSRSTAPAVLLPHSANGQCAPYSNATGLPIDYLIDPCRNWGASQGDKVFTLGFGVKAGQLAGGKLTLSGDVMYSRARTSLDFSGGTYYNNGLTQMVYVPAQNLPALTSTITEIKLGARYDFTKQSAVRVTFLHQRLKSSDPQFDLFGITSVQAYIGPGLQSPRHSVNAISVAYVHTFR